MFSNNQQKVSSVRPLSSCDSSVVGDESNNEVNLSQYPKCMLKNVCLNVRLCVEDL